jgi:HSP20 family protein
MVVPVDNTIFDEPSGLWTLCQRPGARESNWFGATPDHQEVTDMAITRWDPYRNLVSMKREFDRLFRDWDEETPTSASHWRPAVDIYEDENEIVLDVEVPGLKKEDIKINIENDVLTITGERKFERENKEDNFHRIERAYGSFYRSFTLPNKVDSGRIEAKYNDGVLKVSLPKREEAKPRQIDVKVK